MALVVFLHGLSDTPQMWQDALSIVPPGTKMQAPWIKGLRPGQSVAFTRESAANAVLALINQHGVESMSIVGHSIGATVAVTAAQLAPEVIDRLILVAPPAKVPTLIAKAQIATLKAASLESIQAKGIDRVGTIALLTALSGFDTAAEAKRLKTPTLIFDDFGPDFLDRSRNFLAAT